MTEEEFDSIIARLVVDHGIEITIKNSLFGLVYDLNTGMRSGLQIWYKDGDAHYSGRYDVEGMFYGFNDLLYAVKGCMYGWNYGDSNWLMLLEQEGFLTKKVTTVVSYE